MWLALVAAAASNLQHVAMAVTLMDPKFYPPDVIMEEGLAGLEIVAREKCFEIFNCCNGTLATLTQESWSHVKAFAHNYHIRELLDSTPRALERHYTFYNLYDRMKQSGTSQVWAADCFFGVVGILLNAIPAIEFEEGLKSAQAAMTTAIAMLGRIQDQKRANWSIPTEPLDLAMPFLLGLKPNDCFGSSLRIFVYDTGNYSRGSVFCSSGQWGIEVLLHRYFQSSACLTLEPEKADFFFVPDYRACHLHLAPTYQHRGLTRIEGDDFHSSIIWNHKDKYRDASRSDESFQRLIGSLPFFWKKRGLDHIFVFSDQGFIVNFTHTFPSWRDSIPHSIFLTTEAFTPGCGSSCFSPWKDVIVPGHIDQERMLAIRSKNLPTEERTLLFNFHGRLPVNHDYYSNNTVRAAILMFAVHEDVSIGGFIEEYFEVMGKSHFCLVPEGTSSWTNHLYESFFAGCIPLLLSDNFVLPFQDLIDWPSLSIRWPQAEVNEGLYGYLKALVAEDRGVIQAMKQRVDAAACWFDFYALSGGPGACSPYRGILHALEQRKLTMPPYLHLSAWAP